MKASFLLDACLQSGIDFFTGVPDSQLKGLCDELYSRYGADGNTHIVAPNEGNAVALCAGHYLATGHPSLCYMQNSGLGNAVNPLTSLMDDAVYGIPCLLVIGWRGEPGVHDEPQHVKQGAVTLGQLELLGIPYTVLGSDTSEADFRTAFSRLEKALSAGHCAAVVVRKGALETDARPDYSNPYSMTREAAAAAVLDAAGSSDIIVSTTGKLSREIFEIREAREEGHARDFLTVGSMGHAGMIALRMALDLPSRRVWCLDGDGALLMHAGSAMLIGQKKPSNLIHVVMNNGAHETVGGMPVCEGQLNIRGLSEAAGYPTFLTADSTVALQSALNTAIHSEGPVMLEIRCACGARSDLGRPTTTPKQNRDALMRFCREE